MMKYQQDLSYGDIMALNMHFNCPVTTSLVTKFIQDREYYFYHELKQLDVKVTDESERSFLLFPFRLFVEAWGRVGELYPGLAGEYRKMIGQSSGKRPVWTNIEDERIRLFYSETDKRWKIVNDNDDSVWTRSEVTEKNMLIGENWEYLDTDEND